MKPSLSQLQSARRILLALFLLAIVTFAVAISDGLASADHDPVKRSCPDPILEGETAKMRVHRKGYDVEHLYAFTYHEQYSAEPDDFVQYHGDRISSGSGSKSVRIPVITIEDELPEKNETFAIGYWDDNVWHGCEITIIDDDAPEIVEVQITSKPALNITYLASEAIDITVTFTDQVDADEDVLLSLFVGGEHDSTWRGAQYYQGSGTQHLTFRYRVQPADFDPNGVSISSASMDFDRNPIDGFAGRIHIKGTDIPVDYTHPGLHDAGKHLIDGRPIALSTRIISSPPEPWTAYRANQTIKVALTYNIDVVVEGNPTIALGVGWDGRNHAPAHREAEYLSGSGTDTLIFGYTVAPGDNDDAGVAVFLGLPGNGYGGNGTIKAEGTDVDRSPYYLGMGNQAEHKVDTTPPSIAAVTIDSKPKNGEAYATGETIALKIEFSESVTIDGAPYINLDVGGSDRKATLQLGDTGTFVDSAIFHYQIQGGDNDHDGIGLFANSFYLHDGTIYDKAGIGLGLTHAAIAADPDHRVDTSGDLGTHHSE